MDGTNLYKYTCITLYQTLFLNSESKQTISLQSPRRLCSSLTGYTGKRHVGTKNAIRRHVSPSPKNVFSCLERKNLYSSLVSYLRGPEVVVNAGRDTWRYPTFTRARDESPKNLCRLSYLEALISAPTPRSPSLGKKIPRATFDVQTLSADCRCIFPFSAVQISRSYDRNPDP